MLIVLSPAKKLDLSTEPTTSLRSEPFAQEQAVQLVERIREEHAGVEGLRDLMGISENLAELNAQRFEEFHEQADSERARPAIFTFDGGSYKGFELEEWEEQDFAQAQKCLRILSGLYGVLRPMDRMQPYRLEMGTRMENARGANLYDFWGSQIAEQLNEAAGALGTKTLVNLASNEYFKAVDEQALELEIINPVFKDYKSGKYKIISFYAKAMRGAFANAIIRQRLRSPEQLKSLSLDGYHYNEEASDAQNFVYLRRRE